MKRLVVFTAFTLLLCAQGFGQGMGPPSGPNDRSGMAINAEEFVKKAAIGDMFEIEASRLVEPKADADTKPFAQKMIAEHTKTSEELKSLVQSGRVKAQIPTALDPEHQSKLDQLKQQSGDTLDRTYDQMQVQAHKEAITLFENYAQTGDNPDLKDWAAKTLPHLKEHLSMAEKLK
jgi:putative membrane protein